MKRYLYFLIIVILFACEQNQDIDRKTKKDSIEVKSPVKMFEGLPDLPENERQITSAGIGKIHLGDSLNSIDYKYDSVQNTDVYYDGIQWPAKKIFLNNKDWIIAESVNSVSQITNIRTNSPDLITKENYYATMSTDSLDWEKDSIVIDKEKKVFFIYEKGIWFKVDEKSEKKFFKKRKNQDVNDLKNTFIREIFIICGDC